MIYFIYVIFFQVFVLQFQVLEWPAVLEAFGSILKHLELGFPLRSKLQIVLNICVIMSLPDLQLKIKQSRIWYHLIPEFWTIWYHLIPFATFDTWFPAKVHHLVSRYSYDSKLLKTVDAPFLKVRSPEQRFWDAEKNRVDQLSIFHIQFQSMSIIYIYIYIYTYMYIIYIYIYSGDLLTCHFCLLFFCVSLAKFSRPWRRWWMPWWHKIPVWRPTVFQSVPVKMWDKHYICLHWTSLFWNTKHQGRRW